MQKKSKKITETRKAVLKREFRCSRITIYHALKGTTDSDLARNIRARNKQLLEEEIKEIEKIDSAEAES